ncbi:MAG: hypothetical protein ACKOTZ_04830 [Chloroflexota bacterium]
MRRWIRRVTPARRSPHPAAAPGAAAPPGAPDLRIVEDLVLRPPQDGEGDAAIEVRGHRENVGGHWDEIGRLQLAFMREEGLRPDHTLLDIACGSLRGGVHFIPYLEPGHYLWLDRERRLIELGCEQELGAALVAERRPEFVVSDRFAFHRFSRRPDLSIAQSLFTHLDPDDLTLCLGNLRAFVAPGHRLMATYQPGSPEQNPDRSHAHHGFRYPAERLIALGAATGWVGTEVGAWGHPRGQRMIRFRAV